jgi:putative aldouronate transport system permease protein
MPGNPDRAAKRGFAATLFKQRQLAFMAVPIVLYVALFTYAPLWGWTMAFQDYKPSLGFGEQAWVGLKWFFFLFKDETFLQVLRNTLAMSVINLVLGFATAIGLALLLNEVRNRGFKRVVQTLSYLPHFLSWVIVSGLVASMLSSEGGVVNDILMATGLVREPVLFLSEPGYFWWIVGFTNVWKDVGWNTIIYLAAIASIDPFLYEAAEIDGCNRWQKMGHITLPALKPTIVVLLILSVGRILDSGFELQYLLRNGLVQDYSDTIDIFVLTYGINSGNYGLATAAGMFKSLVSVVLILAANWVAKRLGEERII